MLPALVGSLNTLGIFSGLLFWSMTWKRPWVKAGSLSILQASFLDLPRKACTKNFRGGSYPWFYIILKKDILTQKKRFRWEGHGWTLWTDFPSCQAELYQLQGRQAQEARKASSSEPMGLASSDLKRLDHLTQLQLW